MDLYHKVNFGCNPFLLDDISNYLNNDDIRNYCLMYKSKCIGILTVSVVDNEFLMGTISEKFNINENFINNKSCSILGIYIDKEYRGMKLSNLLYSRLYNDLINEGCLFITSVIMSRNFQSLHIHLNQGFKISGIECFNNVGLTYIYKILY